MPGGLHPNEQCRLDVERQWSVKTFVTQGPIIGLLATNGQRLTRACTDFLRLQQPF